MSNKTENSLTPNLRFPEFQGTKGWEGQTLREVCLRITNGKANAEDHEEDGIYPLFDRSAVIKRSSTFMFDSEAVILPGEGMRFVPKYFSGKFNLHQRAYALMEHQGDARFVHYSLDYLKDLLAKKAVKSTVLSLRLPIVENFPISCPRSSEQKKIADCLSSLDELIAAQARKVDALKTHKKGLMQQLFPFEGETQPRLRFPAFRKNGDWKARKIGDMLAETQRPMALLDDAEYRLVTVKRRYGGLISRGVMKGREILVKSQFMVATGDFLISKRQIVHDACGLVTQELNGFIVSNEYSVLTPKPVCSIEFFSWFAMQPVVSASFMNCSVGIVIEKMLFKLPAWLKQEFLFPSLPEQQRIADCLTSFDTLITAATQELETLKTHKKGLMQQLFPLAEAVEA